MPNLEQFPFEFWLSASVYLVLFSWAWLNRAEGWGIPAMMVCITVLFWYHGDAFYNDYADNYSRQFSEATLSSSWNQVSLFGVFFGVFASLLPRLTRNTSHNTQSHTVALLSGWKPLQSVQESLRQSSIGLFFVWLCLFVVALWRTDGNVIGLLAPYIVNTASPWSRGQVATSWFDSFAVVLGNISLLSSALFGVCAVLLRAGAIRNLMVLLIFFTWPTFFLDRARNVMLCVLLPGLVALLFLRWRGQWLLKLPLVLFVALGLNTWFKFVLVNRSQVSIITAFTAEETRAKLDTKTVKHAGLNMFEELCWINRLLEEGRYSPKWGGVYFANLVNPIPRALWPNKPTMGLDYAIARGQKSLDAAGVSGTVSMGMIGSGLVNFGNILGAGSAALIMAFWCLFLTHLDRTGHGIGRLLVYIIGLIGIFNFGRDITLIAAYPALFGFLLQSLAERMFGRSISSNEEESQEPSDEQPALNSVESNGLNAVI